MPKARQNPKLSIVIPAHNEQARLGATLEHMIDYLQKTEPDYEIIVVDDGSSDNTAGLVRELAARQPGLRLIEHVANRGKGAAVRTGMHAAQGELVLFSDADLATPIEELEKLKSALGQGYQVAIASRAVPGSDIQTRQHPARELMGKSFNLLVRMLGLAGFKDTQCGFKLFTQNAARELFRRSRVDHFAFDVEILLLARERFRVAEVPVVWRHVKESKVSPGIDAARMFLDLVRLRLKMWRR